MTGQNKREGHMQDAPDLDLPSALNQSHAYGEFLRNSKAAPQTTRFKSFVKTIYSMISRTFLESD